MRRMICEWTGGSVRGRAVSVLHFVDGTSDITAATKSFFDTMATALQTGVSVTIPRTGDTIDASTGLLTGSWDSGSGPATSVGGGGAFAAGGVGLCITWRTNEIAGRHRVRGRTFIVPLSTAAYQEDGTIMPATLAGLTAAAETFKGNGLQIWHRPSSPGASDGSAHLVSEATVKDHVAVLRSRRD